jgi:hypothetical protein
MTKQKKSPMKRYRVNVYIQTDIDVYVTARTERSAGAIARRKVAKRAIGLKATEALDVDCIE